MGNGLTFSAPTTRLMSGQGRSVSEVSGGPRRVVNGVATLGLIGQPLDPLRRSFPFQVVGQLSDGLLPLAPDHVVAEIQGLIGKEAHMGDPLLPHPLRLAIGADGGGRGGGDADQIR